MGRRPGVVYFSSELSDNYRRTPAPIGNAKHGRDKEFALTLDRADWHLGNWAAWMRTGGLASLNVRLFSLEIGYTRSRTFDDMCEDADDTAACATNAVLGDMTNGERVLREALEVVYLGHAWHRPLVLTPLVDLGKQRVGKRLERRGFV